MRFDLIDKDEKVFGHLDSSKNQELENVGILIVSTSNGNRYFRYSGDAYNPTPTFRECEVMSCFFSEVEHDSNDRANTENS